MCEFETRRLIQRWMKTTCSCKQSIFCEHPFIFITLSLLSKWIIRRIAFIPSTRSLFFFGLVFVISLLLSLAACCSCCETIKTHKYQISHRSKAYSVFLTIQDETVSFLSVFICVHIRSSLLLLFSSPFFFIIILSIVIFCSRQIPFHTCTLCSMHKRNDTFKSKQVTDKLDQKWKKHTKYTCVFLTVFVIFPFYFGYFGKENIVA